MNEYWVPVRLSDLQLEQYCATLLKNSLLLCSSLRSEIVDDLHNTILAILKCGDHPYLVDNALQRRATSDSLNTGIEASGKLQLLDKFLQEIKERGLKVLILYQPTATLSPLCPDIPQTGAAMPHCQNDGFCESAVEVQASSQPALANLAVSSGQSIMRLADPLPLSAEGDMHNFGLQLAVPDGHGPLEMEMIRIQEELKKAKEDFDENVMHLNAARQKEMEELNKKYSLLIRDTMDAFEQKKGELNTNYETIGANKHLALAAYSLMPEDDSFSSMHQHLLPSTHSPAMIPSAAFSQTSLGMTTSASTGRPLVRAVSRLSDLISTDLISSHHGPAHLRSIANPPSTRTARAPPPHLQPFRAPQGMPVTANSWPPELLISLRQANGARGLQNAYNPSI